MLAARETVMPVAVGREGLGTLASILCDGST